MGGKGGSSSGISPAVQSGMLQNETQLVDIATQQAANAQQLFNIAEPGFQTSENFYAALASGDPGAIMRAISPAAQQINQATAGAQADILATTPAGGERNLALEQADVAKGSQIGGLASGAYTGSFNALGQLAGQGVGESISGAGTAISGISSANQDLSSLGGLQLQGQQLQMEQKGQELGGFSSLLNVGGELGAAALLAP